MLENNKLYEILMSDDVVASINNNIDYLLELIPEIKYMIGFEHKHPHHHLDVWNHTLYALSLSECDFDIRLTLLLHDIGKPFSYQEGEVRHFKYHPEVSSHMSKLILKRLNFDDEYINEISKLILLHDTLMTSEFIDNNKELSLKLYKVQYCDALAHHPEKLDKRKEYLNKTKKLILEE